MTNIVSTPTAAIGMAINIVELTPFPAATKIKTRRIVINRQLTREPQLYA